MPDIPFPPWNYDPAEKEKHRIHLHQAFCDDNEGMGQNAFSFFSFKTYFPHLVGENSATIKRGRQNP